MKPYKSILLVALFVIATFAAIPVYASTGHPTLGSINVASGTAPTTAATYAAATLTVGVRAGGTGAIDVDGVATAGRTFAIEFATAGVVFDGSQFSLYLSTNGLSQINSSDIPFTGYFQVSNLVAAAITTTSFTGSIWQNGQSPNFYYGRLTSGAEIVAGAVPYNIVGGYYYIKIYDGSSTSVAVSAQQVFVLPNIAVTPAATTAGTAVAAGTPITVTGVAWPANYAVNLSVSTTGVFVAGAVMRTSTILNTTTNGITNGTFSFTFPMPDEDKLEATTLVGSFGLALEAFNTTTGTTIAGSPSLDEYVATSIFDMGRALWNLTSTDNSGALVAQDIPGSPGYGSGAAPALTAKVLGTIFVNGTDFYAQSALYNPNGTLTAQLNTAGGAFIMALPLTYKSALSSTGTYNVTFGVPVIGLGTYTVEMMDASYNWNFSITVVTTLVISPSRGPIGTPVNVSGYGFVTGANATVFWLGKTYVGAGVNADTDYVLLATFTNITAGSFTFQFAVPANVYGGAHTIYANDSSGTTATGTFTVTASWSLSSSSGQLGTPFYVLGAGLSVGTTTYLDAAAMYTGVAGTSTGAATTYYVLDYDNVANDGYNLFGSGNGVANWTLTAAGVPMVHYVTVENVGTTGGTVSSFTDEAVLAYTVNGTTTGDAQIISMLTSQGTSLTALQTALTALQTTANSILTSSQANAAALTSLASSQASSFSSLSTAVSGISTSLNTLLALRALGSQA